MSEAGWHRALPESDLVDFETCPFQVETEDRRLFGFVVHRGGQTVAYENTCPHLGRTLDVRPGGFLTPERSQLLCMAHGAVFEIESGLCTAGPCLGESLTRVECKLEDGSLWVRLP